MTEEDIEGCERLALSGGETYYGTAGNIPFKMENIVHLQCDILLDLCRMAQGVLEAIPLAKI